MTFQEQAKLTYGEKKAEQWGCPCIWRWCGMWMVRAMRELRGGLSVLCLDRDLGYTVYSFVFFSPDGKGLYLFIYFKIYLFIYFWLCWVFVSVRGLSLVAASGGHSSSRCTGLSLSRPLLLRSTGSRRAGLVAVAHGPSCPAACGIFPDQGSNPCPVYWQADSQPLCHQGSPTVYNFVEVQGTYT